MTLAETLVHEFQHVKLCGLLDMIRWPQPSESRSTPRGGRIPGRRRPAAGSYAHLGIVRFWQVQQHAETESGRACSAPRSFARWRTAIGATVRALLESGLPDPGRRAVHRHDRTRAEVLDAEYADVPGRSPRNRPGSPAHLAAPARGDRPAGVAGWRTPTGEVRRSRADPRGPGSQRTPARSTSDQRSRLLNLSYLEPARYRAVRSRDPSPQRGRPPSDRRPDTQARAGYRARITGSADPQPDAWIGLALALHRLPPSPLRARQTAERS